MKSRRGTARHFAGKLPVPAVTPREWLKQDPIARR
jgi:hypothetical protein